MWAFSAFSKLKRAEGKSRKSHIKEEFPAFFPSVPIWLLFKHFHWKYNAEIEISETDDWCQHAFDYLWLCGDRDPYPFVRPCGDHMSHISVSHRMPDRHVWMRKRSRFCSRGMNSCADIFDERGKPWPFYKATMRRKKGKSKRKMKKNEKKMKNAFSSKKEEEERKKTLKRKAEREREKKKKRKRRRRRRARTTSARRQAQDHTPLRKPTRRQNNLLNAREKRKEQVSFVRFESLGGWKGTSETSLSKIKETEGERERERERKKKANAWDDVFGKVLLSESSERKGKRNRKI